jgi:hypothetical protein
MQSSLRRAADEYRRLAEALEGAAKEVEKLGRGGAAHPAGDLARAVVQRIQVVGAEVDYGTLLRAAADHDAQLGGGVPVPQASGEFPARGSGGTSSRLFRRASAPAPATAPVAAVSPVSPNTLWVDDGDGGRVRYVWVTGLNAAGTHADCWTWYDESNVRLRTFTLAVGQFQNGYRTANEQDARRAAQIIAALRGVGVDVSMMRPLLEFASRKS